jgi:microcystin degradation protein MlrC
VRIAIGQLWQETNAFNPVPTTRADFEAFGVLRGQEIIERMHDTNEPGGFIQSLRAWPERPDVVGLVRLPAWPAGTATAETFEWLRDEVLSSLRAAGKVDAVLLALHGAMCADGVPDVEGVILEEVRRAVGPIPLVATLDLHASVTPRMARSADALVLYHTAPHIDVFETGVRGAAVLRRILIDGVRPHTALVRVPAVLPAELANTQSPTSVSFGLCEHLRKLERRPAILAAGLATVQPWLDIPDHGSAAVVVATNPDDARRQAEALAAMLWGNRHQYVPTLTPIPEAVEAAARECPSGLVVISDSADSTTSGSTGDSVHVLEGVMSRDWPRPVLVPLVDPSLAELKPGTTWEGDLGGKRLPGKSVRAVWEVERSYHAAFTLSGHLGKNLAIDMGPGVVLRRGEVRILTTSRSGPHFAPQFFQVAGFDPFAAAVLVAKSPCGFRAAYEGRARLILIARAPGCAQPDFWTMRYENIPRPLWPWDDGFTPDLRATVTGG